MGGQGLHTAAGRASRPWLTPTRLLDLVEQVVLIGGVIYFYSVNYAPRLNLNLLVVASDALTVFFVLYRRPTEQVSQSPGDWTLALVGTLGAMLMRPGGAPLIPPVVVAATIVYGLVIQIAAKFSLNRRFGLAPANRGIQVRGAYRFVRHPMYLGYLLTQTGYLLLNPTWLNLGVWAIVWACQVGRVFREERFLLTDPSYRSYAGQVRFRLVPGLF